MRTLAQDRVIRGDCVQNVPPHTRTGRTPSHTHTHTRNVPMVRNAAFPDGNLSRICCPDSPSLLHVSLCPKALPFSILRLSFTLARGQGNGHARSFDISHKECESLHVQHTPSGPMREETRSRLSASKLSGYACTRDGFSGWGGGNLCCDGLEALVLDPIEAMTLPVPCRPLPSDEVLLYAPACGFLTAVVQGNDPIPGHLLQPSARHLKVLFVVRDLDEVAPGLLVPQKNEFLQNACLLHVGKVQHPEVYCTLLSKEIEEAQALLDLLQTPCMLCLSQRRSPSYA